MHKLFGKNAEILYICLKYFVVRWFRIILFLLVFLASGYTARSLMIYRILRGGMIIFCLIKIIAIDISCRTKEREVP